MRSGSAIGVCVKELFLKLFLEVVSDKRKSNWLAGCNRRRSQVRRELVCGKGVDLECL